MKKNGLQKSVYSMTGYGFAHSGDIAEGVPVQANSVQIGVEIRSVNSRFLDIACRLPDELRSAEPALRELLQSQLKRGKIELRVSMENAGTNRVQLPSTALLQRLNSLQDNIKTWLPEAQSLGIADVLKISSLEDQPAQAPGDCAAQAIALAKKALSQLLLSRQGEGSRLSATLVSRIEQLQELALQATPLVPQLMAQQKARFMDRFKEAMARDAGTHLPEPVQERAMLEAAAYAVRIDIAEEITRLQAHLQEVDQLLHNGGEVGKRLDFVVQELHREANTLGAKSASLVMTQISIDMKVLIEQVREQVQNLE